MHTIIVNVVSESGSLLQYIIQCKMSNVRWQVFRRYTDFLELHSRLNVVICECLKVIISKMSSSLVC
jgi:hypothetical protein